MTWLNLLAFIQAIYFLVTGVWPLVHMPSFLAVTGQKTDVWLVRTVGVLITFVGATLGLAAYRGEVDPPVVLLAVGSAASLLLVDVIYVSKRVIPKIYLLDAAGEAVLLLGWAACLFWTQRSVEL